MNIKFKNGFVLILTLVAFTSCHKILNPQIKGELAVNQLVSTENGLISLTNGMYFPLLQFHGVMDRLTDLASDDGWTWRNELEPDLFIVTPTFQHTSNLWTLLYQGITNANLVIVSSDLVSNYSSPDSKDIIVGQAYFIRAFYYFHLVRLFGGVPLILNPIIDRTDAEMPRSTIEDTYKQIKDDLNQAENLLPTSYSNKSGMEIGRPTKYSAYALNVLINLELGEWQEVISNSEFILPIGTLLSKYADNFNGTNENSNSSFFEIQYSGSNPGTSSTLSSFLAPSDFQGSALILPTDDNLDGKGGGPSSGNGFVQVFESGDIRMETIIATYGLANFVDASKPNGSLYYVNKYFNNSEPINRSSWNYPLIRYAEILLARAEALNEISYIGDGEAFDLLNQIRSNADLDRLKSSDLPNQNSFRIALRRERRIELSFENKRFFDLNRWGILEESIQPQLDLLNLKFPSQTLINHPFTQKPYFLYPIPATEFVNNSKLGVQNPGYN